MKLLKLILSFFLLVLALPLASVIALSFQNNEQDLFRWYKTIFADAHFMQAFGLSALISLVVAVFAVLASFFLALSWFDKQQRYIMSLSILTLGLIPPDIISLSISKAPQLLGFYESNLFVLIFGLALYCLPFAILLLWSRFYFIEDAIFKSAADLGLPRYNLLLKIIFPLSKAALTSSFILCFLLVFNEYPRTSYLSGADVFLSEYLFGKLSTGTDASIFAGGSLTIGIAVLAIVGFSGYYYWSNIGKNARSI